MIHEGIVCSKCQISPIYGIRYQCSVDPNINYCIDCEAEVSSLVKYPLIKVRDPKKATKIEPLEKEPEPPVHEKLGFFVKEVSPEPRDTASFGILKSKCENKHEAQVLKYKCNEVFNIGWTWVNNGRKAWPEDTQLM
jgi:hypothetical protein